MFLYPRTALGTLDFVNVVSLPSGVTEVPSVEAPTGGAMVSSHTASLSVQQQVQSIDLPSLSVEDQCQVRSLLEHHSSVFPINDTDLGCTSNDIPLLDATPVTQRYRRIPPSEYEVVKEHISGLLSHQVICESSSPYASPICVGKKEGW